MQRSLVKVQSVRSKIDLEALAQSQTNQLGLNDIGKGVLALAQPLSTKPYKENPSHSGIDFKGTARALFYLGSKGGGSTITQHGQCNTLGMGHQTKQGCL